jgi:hypothetical protein
MRNFGQVRQAALDMWLQATKRARQDESDNIADAYECVWQNGFQEFDSERTEHYSVFCSMGEWNTNLTDWLMDDRFDFLTFETNEDKDRLFRHYTIFFLLLSEILTDFQDVLTVFRLGRFPRGGAEMREQNDLSRSQLDHQGMEGTTQNIFNYINSVFKHKTKNLHTCNHHLYFYFEDSGSSHEANGSITIENATALITAFREGSATKIPKGIVVPPVTLIIAILSHCYEVLDQEFKGNPNKFAAFCQVYQGVSVRPYDAPSETTE